MDLVVFAQKIIDLQNKKDKLQKGIIEMIVELDKKLFRHSVN